MREQSIRECKAASRASLSVCTWVCVCECNLSVRVCLHFMHCILFKQFRLINLSKQEERKSDRERERESTQWPLASAKESVLRERERERENLTKTKPKMSKKKRRCKANEAVQEEGNSERERM